MSKINIKNFDINQEDIPLAVKKLFDDMPSVQVYQLNKVYGSALDFLHILFHLQFVKKMSVRQIAENLNLQPPNVKRHLYNFGWDYSQDYEKSKDLVEAQRKKFAEVLSRAKNTFLGIEEHTDLKDVLAKSQNLGHAVYSKMNFKTGEEMGRTLYYLVRVEGLSRKDMAALFGMNIDAVRRRLLVLGLATDHEEGIRLKKIRGSQNYDKTNLSIKKTRLDSQISQHSTGSVNEDVLRKKLSLLIYDYIDYKHEAVVGLSNTGILGEGKEIDIPIVVYQRDTQKVFRFAVEYNGVYYHDEQRDTEKKNLCEDMGWYYLSVEENSSSQFSNNPKLIENEARRLCEEIVTIIQNARG